MVAPYIRYLFVAIKGQRQLPTQFCGKLPEKLLGKQGVTASLQCAPVDCAFLQLRTTEAGLDIAALICRHSGAPVFTASFVAHFG